MAITTYNSTLKEWENIIRVQLKVTNPALLKSGALGVLTNYLAGIKYDAFQFYTKTFQELNVGLAQDYNSLIYHAGIYGATVSFAKPAALSSSIVIPQLNLATSSKLVYNIPAQTQFSTNNGIPFLIPNAIQITLYSGDRISAYIINDGERNTKLLSSISTNPDFPTQQIFLVHGIEALQYSRTFESHEMPKTSVGQTETFIMGIDDVENLKSVRVWVNTGDKISLTDLYNYNSDKIEEVFDDTIEYNVKFQKYGSSFRDQDVFVELFGKSIEIETGDGIHGVHIPEGAQLIFETQITMGEQGNIPNAEYILPNILVSESIVDTTTDPITQLPQYENRLINYPTTVSGVSTIGAHGGAGVGTAEEIRDHILNRISIRNSIITENDYERVYAFQGIKPFVDAKFVDAKAFVFLFNVIHVNDQLVPSTSVNLKEIDLVGDANDDNVNGTPFYPKYDYSGVELISPFYYKNSGPNEVDAYIVEPELGIPVNIYNVVDMGEYVENDFKINLAVTYEFQDGTTTSGKSYIEILEGAVENFVYTITVEGILIPVILEASNNFKMAIDSESVDEFCVLLGPISNFIVQISEIKLNTYNGTTQEERIERVWLRSETDQTFEQLLLKQTFFKYFMPADENTTYPIQLDTNAYLDNILDDKMSTVVDLFATPGDNNFETYILRLPFFSLEYFYSMPSTSMHEVIDQYFIVNYTEDLINYNTQLTQTFHNTIDLPSKFFDYLFQENTNGTLNIPMLNIDIDVYVDNDNFLVSAFDSSTDLKIDMSIKVIKFLKEYEGFMIEFYETDLEKFIYDTYSPLINNVKVNSPTLFIVNNSATIYNQIEDNLEFKDILDFVPPYFYYNYDEINIKIKM